MVQVKQAVLLVDIGIEQRNGLRHRGKRCQLDEQGGKSPVDCKGTVWEMRGQRGKDKITPGSRELVTLHGTANEVNERNLSRERQLVPVPVVKEDSLFRCGIIQSQQREQLIARGSVGYGCQLLKVISGFRCGIFLLDP